MANKDAKKAASDRRYYLANREKILVRQKKWQKQWNDANGDSIAQDRAARAAKREQDRARGKAYRESEAWRTARRQGEASWREKNREKLAKRQRLYEASNPHKAKMSKTRNRYRRYGISFEEFQAKVSHQNGVCAICGNPETATFKGAIKALAVDHCHRTNAIRGLLCGNCNTAIGLFKDDETRLAKAILYLRGSKNDTA